MAGMMNTIQAIVADKVYQGALENQNETIKPTKEFPKPTPEQYEEFRSQLDLSLSAILDSPIGVYQFKKFGEAYDGLPVLIEFLVQFERVKALDAPDNSSAKELMAIALHLPNQYMVQVGNLRKAYIAAFGPIDFEVRVASAQNYVDARVASIDYDLNDEEGRAASSFPIDSHGNEVFPDPRAPRPSAMDSLVGPGTMKRNDLTNSLLSPFGRSSVTFGGYLHTKKKVAAEARQSSVLTEFMGEAPKERPKSSKAETNLNEVDLEAMNGEEDTGDFYDRQYALRMKEHEEKVKLRQDCLKVFSDLGELLRLKVEEYLESFKEDPPEFVDMVNMMWYSNQPMLVDDFLLFRDLGRGAFGVVSSAKTKTTGALTAIKCMSKKLIKGKKARKLVVVEKAILEILGDNPSNFTVWLKYSFQDKDYFYMAIPLCTGGDLNFHLRKKHCFDVDRAKYHFAEILEGIDHLHSLGIVYRDLKPENVIFDSEGHARISDMGLAIQTNGHKIKGRAGTPGYWAPEVISRSYYSFSADFWSLGCVLYEMLTGLCPFSTTNTRMERDKATLQWPIKFPPRVGRVDKPEEQKPFPDEAKGVILGLLDRNRTNRFDANDVRADPFLSNIDWNLLRLRQLPTPWRPKKGQIYAADLYDIDRMNQEKRFDKEKIGPEDEIPNFEYSSIYSHQIDIVEVLNAKDNGKLKLEKGYVGSFCCFM